MQLGSTLGNGSDGQPIPMSWYLDYQKAILITIQTVARHSSTLSGFVLSILAVGKRVYSISPCGGFFYRVPVSFSVNTAHL